MLCTESQFCMSLSTFGTFPDTPPFFFFLSLFCLIGAAMEIPCSLQPRPQPQQHQIRAASATYTTAHSNTGSLTHWVRSGMKSATSWFFASAAPRGELRDTLPLVECKSIFHLIRISSSSNADGDFSCTCLTIHISPSIKQCLYLFVHGMHILNLSWFFYDLFFFLIFSIVYIYSCSSIIFFLSWLIFLTHYWKRVLLNREPGNKPWHL